MGFYFYGKYIYTDGDEQEIEKDMYAVLPYFWVLMIRMGMKNRKIILRISLGISS